MNLTANWNYPTNIRVGAGRYTELADLCRKMGIKSPMIVTDPGLAEMPMLGKVTSQIRISGLNCGCFFDIQSNPTGDNVEQGVTFFHDNLHDGIVAIGGGSTIDAAKAIALMVGQQRPIWDFEDVGENWTRVNTAGIAPVIALPTTAGTGSEVGRASVITDTDQRVKKIIFHPNMLPQQVILDPELTVDLPPALTAATGMDALSHNLEAFCSPFYHPLADGIAVEGIRLVQQYLPRAFHDGQDIEARTQMLVCSSMGATAFQKGLGAMHALAHPLGALYNAHHGTLNAILMPYVLQANLGVIEDRLTRLARFLDLAQPGAEGFIQWVLQLREELNIPASLAAIGIDDKDADLVAQMATEDPSAAGNPIDFSIDQYRQLFLDAIDGRL